MAASLAAHLLDEDLHVCADDRRIDKPASVSRPCGLPVSGKLLEAFEKHPDFSRNEKVRIDMLRRFGYYSTESNGHLSEYVPWYRKRLNEISQWIDLFGLDPAHVDRPIDLGKKPAKHPAAGRSKPAQHSPVKSQENKKGRTRHGFPKKT